MTSCSLSPKPRFPNHALFILKLPSYPRWLLLLDNTQTPREIFQDIYVPFNCEVLVAQNSGFEIKLTEVYQVAEGFPLNERAFGSWSNEAGLNATKLSLYERRRDLEGVTIKAIGMEVRIRMFVKNNVLTLNIKR